MMHDYRISRIINKQDEIMNAFKRNTLVKKSILLGSFFLLIVKFAVCQAYTYPMPDYTPSQENLQSREMFKDMKFGMFIHWGIYSVLGDGEWVMHVEKIPYKNYKRLAGFFNPEQFNAKDIVGLAKAAGMKYITITSRHHDGFSMFKTAASDYNIVEATPYHKDPLKELLRSAVIKVLNYFFIIHCWIGEGPIMVSAMPLLMVNRLMQIGTII